MKKLCMSIVICLVLFSCKKEPKVISGPAPDNGSKYSITFDLKDFSPQVLGVKENKTSEEPLSEKVSYLAYIAFNEDGKEVSRIRQFASGRTVAYRYREEGISDEYNPGAFPFGTFTDSLPNGDYTVVMIASQAQFGINSHNEVNAELPVAPLASSIFIYEYRQLENVSRTKDTFYKKFQLKVEDKDSNQQVVLERIVGKAEINILDAKPELSYYFYFIDEAEGYTFGDNMPYGVTQDTFFFAGATRVVTRDKSRFDAFIINTDSSRPIDIIIEEVQGGNTVLTKKIIEKVPFFKNKRTILTGNIHSSASDVGFNIKVDGEFDQDTINVGF